MTTHKEALTLALAEFENQKAGLEEVGVIDHSLDELITAIKEALAQPEQEPVAVVETIGGYPDESAHVAKWLVPYKSLKAGDKLYTTPPQRKPLTDEQIVAIYGNDMMNYRDGDYMRFARAIEAAHGIKE